MPAGLENRHPTCLVDHFEEKLFLMRFILETTFGFGPILLKFLPKCSNRANKLHSTCHSEQLQVAKPNCTKKN